MFIKLLTWGKIPCQQGEDSPMRSPKLNSLAFGITISDGITCMLPSTKEVSIHKGGLEFFSKEDLECSPKEDLGLFFKFLCFRSTTKCMQIKHIWVNSYSNK